MCLCPRTLIKLLYFVLSIVTIKEAIALRDGKKRPMNAEDLVVGDIVFVKFGDRLPADLRVIEAKGFKVQFNNSY